MSASGEPTARSERERELEFRATHDPLTGLANRTLLFDRIRRATEGLRGAGTDRSVALLFIDLDHFKVVNDHLGHRFGDRILEIAAERISSVVRPGDTVARFGGDEFVVLLQSVNSYKDIVDIRDRLAAALAAPHEIADERVKVSASIGASLMISADDRISDMLHRADGSMYAVKRDRRRNATTAGYQWSASRA